MNLSKYKTRPCKHYHSSAGCPRGDNCHFIHDPMYAGREIVNFNINNYGSSKPPSRGHHHRSNFSNSEYNDNSSNFQEEENRNKYQFKHQHQHQHQHQQQHQQQQQSQQPQPQTGQQINPMSMNQMYYNMMRMPFNPQMPQMSGDKQNVQPMTGMPTMSQIPPNLQSPQFRFMQGAYPFPMGYMGMPPNMAMGTPGNLGNQSGYGQMDIHKSNNK